MQMIFQDAGNLEYFANPVKLSSQKPQRDCAQNLKVLGLTPLSPNNLARSILLIAKTFNLSLLNWQNYVCACVHVCV